MPTVEKRRKKKTGRETFSSISTLPLIQSWTPTGPYFNRTLVQPDSTPIGHGSNPTPLQLDSTPTRLHSNPTSLQPDSIPTGLSLSATRLDSREEKENQRGNRDGAMGLTNLAITAAVVGGVFLMMRTDIRSEFVGAQPPLSHSFTLMQIKSVSGTGNRRACCGATSSRSERGWRRRRAARRRRRLGPTRLPSQDPIPRRGTMEEATSKSRHRHRRLPIGKRNSRGLQKYYLHRI